MSDNKQPPEEPVIIALDKISQGGSLSDGEFGFFDSQTADGKVFRFTFPPHLLAPLRDCFYQIQGRVNAERERAGKATLMQTAMTKKVSGWQFGEDHGAKVAVIRTVFQDHSHQDTAIPMDRIQEVVTFLRAALHRFQQSSQSPKDSV